MSDVDEVVGGIIPKSDSQDVRVRLATYDGVRRVDIRLFVDRDDGARGPTRKGVSVPAEKLPQLREAVDALIAAVD